MMIVKKKFFRLTNAQKNFSQKLTFFAFKNNCIVSLKKLNFQNKHEPNKFAGIHHDLFKKILPHLYCDFLNLRT